MNLEKQAFVSGFLNQWSNIPTPIKSALIGSGVGGLGGLLYEKFRGKKRGEPTDYLSSALMGSGLGGLVGGAGGTLASIPGMLNEPDDTEKKKLLRSIGGLRLFTDTSRRDGPNIPLSWFPSAGDKK